MATKKKRRKKKKHLKKEDFVYLIYKRTRVRKKVRGKVKYKYIYKRISYDNFVRNRVYRIYIKHKPTGDRRLLGFGTFTNIPILSKFTDREHYYQFEPQKKKPRKRVKGWIPAWKYEKEIVTNIEKEIDPREGKLRAALIPMRKYFHPEMEIFSDEKVNPDDYAKVVGVNVLIHYVYGDLKWYNKRTIILDLRDGTNGRGFKFKNLVEHKPELEDLLNFWIDVHHPSRVTGESDISIARINGFIPATYIPKRVEY